MSPKLAIRATECSQKDRRETKEAIKQCLGCPHYITQMDYLVVQDITADVLITAREKHSM